ncbi:MAG: YgdI/YgdR family lipoprotein [Verrucomicrobia bacterium]|nr:YgdI/YgdR family lipoprotein [Verrucomicrobiota bacterium]
MKKSLNESGRSIKALLATRWGQVAKPPAVPTRFVARLLPVVLLMSFLVSGCARSYVITLNNGARIATKGKPKLEGGAYVFKDVKGQPGHVSAGRVREIAPASMSRTDESPFLR